MKLQLSPRSLLEFILLGLRNGNYQAVIDIVNDALAQLPPDAEFTKAKNQTATPSEGDLDG